MAIPVFIVYRAAHTIEGSDTWPSEPKTLLQMAGASNAPPPLSESTVVVIDAQREYTDGKLPLTNVAARAR